MSPLDKALQLVVSFTLNYPDLVGKRYQYAQDCALKCVNEILEVLPNMVNLEENFWNKVKLELENL